MKLISFMLMLILLFKVNINSNVVLAQEDKDYREDKPKTSLKSNKQIDVDELLGPDPYLYDTGNVKEYSYENK